MRVITTFLVIFLLSVAAFAQNDKPCDPKFVDACTNAANRLVAADTLIAAQKQEIEALRERLALEQQRSALYKEIADVRTAQRQDLIEIIKLQKEQNDNLREIVKTGNETIRELARVKKPDGFWAKVGKEITKALIYLGVAAIATR